MLDLISNESRLTPGCAIVMRMTDQPEASRGFGIEDLDLSKIAEALTPRLNGFISSENIYLHEGTRKEPKFTVVAIFQHQLAIDAVLAIETDYDPGIAFAGYQIEGAATRFNHPLGASRLYNDVASRLWVDQLAGDYPIGKVDFDQPWKITWPFHATQEVRPGTLKELIDFSQPLIGSNDLWMNTAFAEEKAILLKDYE